MSIDAYWTAVELLKTMDTLHTFFIDVGAVPDKRTPSVLVSTRLSEVRGFSDFYSEFFQVGMLLVKISPGN